MSALYLPWENFKQSNHAFYVFYLGFFLLHISLNFDEWLGSEDGEQKPQTSLLSLMFFLGIFFASIQNIAVSGWSLTMLKK